MVPLVNGSIILDAVQAWVYPKKNTFVAKERVEEVSQDYH